MRSTKEPFNIRQVAVRAGDIEPLDINSQSDRERLKERVLAVAKPGRYAGIDIGYEELEYCVLTEAARAQMLYRHRYKNAENVELDLRYLEWLCRETWQVLDRVKANNLISSEALQEARSLLDQSDDHTPLQQKLANYERHLTDRKVFLYDPSIVAGQPLVALSDSCFFVGEAISRQRGGPRDDFEHYSFPDRPESDAIGRGVYDLWRTFRRDKVYFPGGDTGPCALLYYELCRLSGIPEGSARDVLRKFRNIAPE